MIENNGKNYYTTFEMLELVNDENTEVSKLWKKRFPKRKNREIVLFEQVSRVLYQAKKEKKVSCIEFTKCEGGSKKYFAFSLEGVIEFLKQDSNFIKAFNIKIIDKE